MQTHFPVLLFDFEGTLVDFQWKLKDGAREIKEELRRMGFDPSDWENDYAQLRNRAVRESAQIEMGRQAVIERLNPIYDRFDQDAATRWTVFPQVKPTLTRLKNERHVKMGLVSNVGRRTLDQVLPRLGLDGLFAIIVTRNDVEELKPSGEGIKTALAKLGGQRGLFVGDSVTDIRGAKEAGAPVAIIQGGENAPEVLSAAQPDYLWRTIAELESLYHGGATNP